MSEDRFKEVFRRLTSETPDAPAFSDLETHRAKPAPPIRLKPWMAAVGAAALVLVVVGVFGLLGGGGSDLAAPDESTIDYVKLEYSATVNPVCEGGEIIDNGGFDEATIEIWGPNGDDWTLMVATFPDGSTERTVVEGDPFDPERAWGIDPAVFEEETGFRSVRCSNPPDWAIFAPALLSPPYQPGYTPDSYLRLPPGYDTWDEFLDYDKSLSELNGNAVTVHSLTESLTAGEYHIEFYVSVDDPAQLLGQLYEYDLPAQGALTMQMTVVDLKRVATDSVSFSTAGLFLIDEPGAPFLGEGEIPADCHVTIANQTFTPPESHPATPSSPDMVWFGRNELWTAVSTDGISDGRKSVWWSSEFTDPGTESSPEITVTYTLLNGSSPLTIVNDQGTNASTPEDGLFIIAGSEPDIEGCWQVTAIYKDASLSYIYYNPEGQDPATATPTVVVPDVIGMTVYRAGNVLRDAGYIDSPHDSDDLNYEVCAQEPGAGVEINPGATVGLRTAPPGWCEVLLDTTISPNGKFPTYTDEEGRTWYATSCPNADVLLRASPIHADELPKYGATDFRSVNAAEATLGEVADSMGIVSAASGLRHGDVWDEDGAITTRWTRDYLIEATIDDASNCPTSPYSWDGVPVAFILVGDD